MKRRRAKKKNKSISKETKESNIVDNIVKDNKEIIKINSEEISVQNDKLNEDILNNNINTETKSNDKDKLIETSIDKDKEENAENIERDNNVNFEENHNFKVKEEIDSNKNNEIFNLNEDNNSNEKEIKVENNIIEGKNSNQNILKEDNFIEKVINIEKEEKKEEDNADKNNIGLEKNEIVNAENNNQIIKKEEILEGEKNIKIKNEIKEKKENNTDKKDKEENENQNNENKKNSYKIANIEYEKFIKENAKLYEYIKKVNIPIKIKSPKNNKNEGIKLKNNSLIKIINQSALENEFKIYLTIQIITETFQFETSSNKNITFNSTIQNYIKKINKLNISFHNEQKCNKNDILIRKESFIKIFLQMGKDYNKDIYNYMEFIITEISYEYSNNKKVYVLKGVKILKKLMEQNKLFFINKNDSKDELYNEMNNIIPITNYSITKIFNLFDGGKDTKYLLLNYKIKTEDFIKYENDNKHLFDALVHASDIKSILTKYKIESEKDSLFIFKQEQLNRFKEINIFDLDNYLNITEQKFFNIIGQIKNKKKEIIKLAEEEKNQFIQVIDSLENTKFCNRQYLKLMKEENNIFNQNIHSFDFYDFNNEIITVTNKNLEKFSKEDKIYVQIKIKDNNYLVNKNKILKIYDSWKILYQEDTIDAIDIKKIKEKLKEFDNEKIKILLLDAKIIEHDVIKEIKINEIDEENENKNEKKNNENEINDDNLIIIEEEENEEDKKLRNKGKVVDKEKNKKKMIEYIYSLPQKKTYNIKYKIKTERIPKKKKI